jgi:hypothetical protein
VAGEPGPGSPAGVVTDLRRDGHAPVLVCFGGLDGQDPGAPRFELQGLTARLPVHRVFVRDLEQCWYQRGLSGLGDDVDSAADGLRTLLEAVDGSPSVFVGTSSGGYAAILFGVLARADRIVALSPQASLRWRDRFRARDRRWPAQVRKARRSGTDRCHLDLVALLREHPDHPPVSVHFGERDPRDTRAAHALGRVDGVELIGHPGGHLFVRKLRDAGGLEPVLAAALGLSG